MICLYMLKYASIYMYKIAAVAILEKFKFIMFEIHEKYVSKIC